MSRGSFRSAGSKPGVDCCHRAPRGMSRGSVRSSGMKPDADCCDGAPSGMSKGSFRSASMKPGVDCCNRAPRGMSRGSIRSAKCIRSHRKKPELYSGVKTTWQPIVGLFESLHMLPDHTC